MREPDASASGSDQSLQVRSGLAELAEGVRKRTEQPGGTAPRKFRLPQRDAVPESCTGASKEPLAPGVSPSRKMRPMLLVAASTEWSDGSRRVVSPSLVCATSVTRRSGARP